MLNRRSNNQTNRQQASRPTSDSLSSAIGNEEIENIAKDWLQAIKIKRAKMTYRNFVFIRSAIQ
jgi:hypothetical protein